MQVITRNDMTAAERAYTREYSYVAPSAYAREYARQLPSGAGDPRRSSGGRKGQGGEMELLPERGQRSIISRAVLLRSVLILLTAGALLVGTVWMSAKATQIKYSINRTNNEIRLLENEINTLNIKIQSANGIEYVEEYTIDKLGMRYPKSNQCIYIEEGASVRADLAAEIKEKAYSNI